MQPLTLMFLHIFVNKTQKAKSLKKESCPIEVEKNLQYMNNEVIDIRWKLGEYLTTNGYQYENTYVERKNELTLCRVLVPDSRTAHL